MPERLSGFTERPVRIEQYRRASIGELFVHEWRSRTHPEVVMSHYFSDTAEKPDHEAYESETYQPYYAGVLSAADAEVIYRRMAFTEPSE